MASGNLMPVFPVFRCVCDACTTFLPTTRRFGVSNSKTLVWKEEKGVSTHPTQQYHSAGLTPLTSQEVSPAFDTVLKGDCARGGMYIAIDSIDGSRRAGSTQGSNSATDDVTARLTQYFEDLREAMLSGRQKQFFADHLTEDYKDDHNTKNDLLKVNFPICSGFTVCNLRMDIARDTATVTGDSTVDCNKGRYLESRSYTWEFSLVRGRWLLAKQHLSAGPGPNGLGVPTSACPSTVPRSQAVPSTYSEPSPYGTASIQGSSWTCSYNVPWFDHPLGGEFTFLAGGAVGGTRNTDSSDHWTLSGNSISWSVGSDQPMHQRIQKYIGTVNGDVITGTVYGAADSDNKLIDTTMRCQRQK
jgi:hypothetical protein